MILGVPVISSDCNSGPSEILVDGKYGDLFEIRDYNKLSELIIKEYNSRESKNKSDLIAQRSSNFSINEISRRYAESFEKLLT